MLISSEREYVQWKQSTKRLTVRSTKSNTTYYVETHFNLQAESIDEIIERLRFHVATSIAVADSMNNDKKRKVAYGFPTQPFTTYLNTSL